MVLAMFGALLGAIVKFTLMIAVLLFAALTLYARTRPVKQPHSSARSKRLIVGFFHPYCNSGGGGERVLWQCIHALHAIDANIHCVVYTGDTDAAPDQILQRAYDRFNVAKFDTSRLSFVYLSSRPLLSDARYPHFTMLLQSLVSMLVGAECLVKWKPHLWFDTTGFAFTYPVASLLYGCKVLSYTHYPTISTDMLAVVSERRPAYNNDSSITGSAVKNTVKLVYYYLFTFLYFCVGQFPSIVLVNSRWTAGHVDSLWQNWLGRIQIVYPPCDTKSLQSLPLLRPRPAVSSDCGTTTDTVADNTSRECREDWIVSVGQFRPEKDHPLQIRAFHRFRQEMKQSQYSVEHVRLVLIGGVRDDGDRQRVAELRALCQSLDVSNNVDFVLNEPFDVLQRYLGRSLVGLHTMWNEHFGMGVVEFGAAGLLVLAHDSGGPRMDIIVDTNGSGQRCGFLATTEAEFCAQLCQIFGERKSRQSELQAVRMAARLHCATEFSDEKFLVRFHRAVEPFVDQCFRQYRVARSKKTS